MYVHIFLIHSPTGRHPNKFHFSASVISTATNWIDNNLCVLWLQVHTKERCKWVIRQFHFFAFVFKHFHVDFPIGYIIFQTYYCPFLSPACGIFLIFWPWMWRIFHLWLTVLKKLLDFAAFQIKDVRSLSPSALLSHVLLILFTKITKRHPVVCLTLNPTFH